VSDGKPVVVRNAYGQLTLNAKVDAQVQPGTLWIPESLPGAPLGTLFNGSELATATVQPVGALQPS